MVGCSVGVDLINILSGGYTCYIYHVWPPYFFLEVLR